MGSSWDTVVVGLGAMGSAAAYHLARRGHAVLGIDRFRPPHDLGSSHGQTRIIREAYFEHPVYVPMVRRAYELWRELERDRGLTLYRQTGGIMIGERGSDLVQGALRSAREHGLAHEVLDATAVRSRYPALAPEPGMIGVVEPRAGILFPEACVQAHLDLAREAGAQLRFDERVLRCEPGRSSVRIVTTAGEYEARRAVISAGPWVSELVPDLALPFTIERQVLFWFDAPGAGDARDAFDPTRCPVHLWQFDGRQFFYGFPDVGEGIKVARHHRGRAVTPDSVQRDVDPAEVADIRVLVRRFLSGVQTTLRRAAACLYTNTPDEHFWIDRHPHAANVLLVSPCSGHGFKFAPVIGEIVADLVEAGTSRFDLSLFRARTRAS